MIWWMLGILLTLVGLQLLALQLLRRHDNFDKAAASVNGLATATAILFAGYWYVYERKGQPQADTALKVVGLKVSPEYVTLQARFSVKNLGATLLQLGGTDVRLMAVNADSLPLGRIAALGREDFPDRIGGKSVFDDGALTWPTVRWFHGGAPRRVEPGETDLRVVDFVASCSNTAMRVYFAMERPGTDEVWQDMATLSLSALCAKPVGSKEVLSD